MKRVAVTCLAVVMTFSARAADLSEKDKQFLTAYEKIHVALANDDLAGARTAGGDLGDEGSAMGKSTSLKEARAAFEKLSDKAKQLAAGQPGFSVVTCPMLKKDWVQTSEKIANPYYGKEMATCGEIKK